MPVYSLQYSTAQNPRSSADREDGQDSKESPIPIETGLQDGLDRHVPEGSTEQEATLSLCQGFAGGVRLGRAPQMHLALAGRLRYTEDGRRALGVSRDYRAAQR
jgi:hypothetical protein